MILGKHRSPEHTCAAGSGSVAAVLGRACWGRNKRGTGGCVPWFWRSSQTSGVLLRIRSVRKQGQFCDYLNKPYVTWQDSHTHKAAVTSPRQERVMFGHFVVWTCYSEGVQNWWSDLVFVLMDPGLRTALSGGSVLWNYLCWQENTQAYLWVPVTRGVFLETLAILLRS